MRFLIIVQNQIVLVQSSAVFWIWIPRLTDPAIVELP